MEFFPFPGEALGKAEIIKTELEGELHKSRAEEAALKDALAKMQALNEGLGQDKIELNKIIMQVSVFSIRKSCSTMKHSASQLIK